MTPILTEQLPSSGSAPCEHKWQVVEEKGDRIMMVCAKANCNAIKNVPKPKAETNDPPKKGLLLG